MSELSAFENSHALYDKLEVNFIKTTVTGGKDVKKYIISNLDKKLIYTDKNDKINTRLARHDALTIDT